MMDESAEALVLGGQRVSCSWCPPAVFAAGLGTQRGVESPRLRRHAPRPEVPLSLASGTRLDPYEILTAIGAGGTGDVYMACDTRLDRPVAIRPLPQEHTPPQALDARGLLLSWRQDQPDAPGAPSQTARQPEILYRALRCLRGPPHLRTSTNRALTISNPDPVLTMRSTFADRAMRSPVSEEDT